MTNLHVATEDRVSVPNAFRELDHLRRRDRQKHSEEENEDLTAFITFKSSERNLVEFRRRPNCHKPGRDKDIDNMSDFEHGEHIDDTGDESEFTSTTCKNLTSQRSGYLQTKGTQNILILLGPTNASGRVSSGVQRNGCIAATFRRLLRLERNTEGRAASAAREQNRKRRACRVERGFSAPTQLLPSIVYAPFWSVKRRQQKQFMRDGNIEGTDLAVGGADCVSVNTFTSYPPPTGRQENLQFLSTLETPRNC